MILYYKITLKNLAENGKNYNWKPCHCENCQRTMWGHGYVGRYFSNTSHQIFLKRYRCPQCKVVVTVRPIGYWSYIRSSIASIFKALKAKIATGFWIHCPRQRGGHWLREFVANAKMSCENNLLTFLDRCFGKNLNFFA